LITYVRLEILTSVYVESAAGGFEVLLQERQNSQLRPHHFTKSESYSY